MIEAPGDPRDDLSDAELRRRLEWRGFSPDKVERMVVLRDDPTIAARIAEALDG